MRIGLFGGSFNPIHNGHIALGKAMMEHLRLDEVWYMVSPQNPLKQSADDLAPEDVRLHLTQLALQPYHPRLKACDYEFHLERPSYTWTTLQHLWNDYPEHEFTIIIGADNWLHFDRWWHHDDILRSCDIAVYPREGADVDAGSLPANVHIVDVPLVNVTSTMLREMMKNGEDVSAFTAPEVAREAPKYSCYR